MPRLRLLLPLLLLLAGPATAGASTHQFSIMMDDRLLLNPSTRDAALDRMQALGVDEVHSLLIWRQADRDGFGAWDGLVDAARARGMAVILTPTAPIPPSASDCPSQRLLCRPNIGKFQRFVTAAARHFGRRVTRWSIWNEPNLDGWLLPQRVRARSGRYLYNARRYRDLFRAAARGLAAAGHRRDQILLGETAPVASQRAIPPLDFLRAVFCLDGRDRPLKGAAARDRGCRGFTRLPATGLAHHPYTPAAACSPRCKGGPQDATIASLGRLNPVLDAAARYGRIPQAARARIYFTEFGFQSNPPNRGGVISTAQQARYLNWSEAIAYANPRVRSFANYELQDPGAEVFNTGLLFLSGREKPAYAAWRVPLYVTRVKRGVRIFGGVRPGGSHTLAIRGAFRRGGFATLRTVRTNYAGYISLFVRTGRTRFRLQSGALASRTATW